MFSFAYQLISTRQEGNLELEGGEIAAQWVRFAFVVAAAALNTKAVALWSESRILRKIRARHPRQLRDSVLSDNPDHAFAELYVSLSKGRHRTYSQHFSLLYYIFLFCLDIVDIIDFFNPDHFDSGVSSSEELTAFRLLIYVGSFATLGAVKPTIVQSALLVFCNLTLATLHVVSGYDILRLSDAVRTGLAALQLTLISSFFIFWAIQRHHERRTSLPGIISRMASVRESNFHDRDLERINLRNSLSERQSKRLKDMEGLAMRYSNFDANKAREIAPWFDRDFGDFVIFILVSGISALSWGNLSQDEVPRIVFLGCLEAMSTFLLYINNSVVERMLFVKLLHIARIPRSGSHGASSLINQVSFRTL